MQDVPSKLSPSLADVWKEWLGGEKSWEPRAKHQIFEKQALGER